MPAFLRRFETLLAVALIVELAVFSLFGTNFASWSNLSDIITGNAGLVLLALAMMPVILTGGIDLSVGSLLGLCAVLFGKLWRDAALPPAVAAIVTLAIGAAGGAVNAFFIARLRLPPLIVTLGTFSLYRGLAEAITRGVDNFTNFPASFLWLGQGSLFGFFPVPALVLLLAAGAVWLLVHRTVFGRSFRAIGFAPEGAEYAGLAVKSRVALVYIMAGVLSAVAALLYAAHVNQAKADAGTGSELVAITAVVLGGSSIFGGTGAVHGTLLGLAILLVLRNGIALADLPAELAGILTGVLLLTVLTVEILAKRLQPRRAT
jgi:rhamnose transport system permease protein